jgi:GT2 family glycosyltransferase
MSSPAPNDYLAIVVIGRNEGLRLADSLKSALANNKQVVYVDSGSTDGSLEFAGNLGAHAIALDKSKPFTAARGRKVGFEFLVSNWPEAEYVQFIDGDCILQPGWVEKALVLLNQNPDWAVVCGRRREEFPQASIYNQLLDFEWATPIGISKYSGGDSLMRVSALKASGGWREDIPCGEEPELCVRLRSAGWKIYRADTEMTLHDGKMLHFSQWWRRSTRAGYAYALGAYLHGAPPERHWVKEKRRALFWGGALPLALIALAFITNGLGLLGFSVYLFQWARLSSAARKQGSPIPIAQGFFWVLGKFAEFIGVLQFQRIKRAFRK